MTPRQENTFVAAKRWFAILFLLVVAASVIVRSTVDRKRRETIETSPQTAQPTEIDPFNFIQTALDRSIQALARDPDWRDGFHGIPFENGTYDVTIADATDDGNGDYDPSIPSNFVRIIATGRIEGVTKKVEAFWVDPMSAFRYVFAAGNEIRIDETNGGGCIVVGDIHNNAWHDGELVLAGATTVYGSVTSPGRITIGSSDAVGPATVHGSVTGRDVTIGGFGDVHDFEDLNEWFEGIDLTHDGDREDLYVSKRSAAIGAVGTVISAGRSLSNGETDPHVADGTQPVDIGVVPPGTVVDPRPSFKAYYELVTGLGQYPPPLEHFWTDIPGDGDGHYFASSSNFLEWINSHVRMDAVCWRCAGDGRIGPENDVCPSCNATGTDLAVEITGVFYIDDDTVDLTGIETNLIVHGTIVVALGNPYQWPSKTVRAPGGTTVIDHFPREGRLVIGGPTRMNFTQTYRSKIEGGAYAWRHRSIHSRDDEQLLAIPEPESGQAMCDYPAVLAASRIDISTRRVGFARCAGDIGGEALTLFQGLLFAEELVRIDGQGGWRGDPVVFDEQLSRSDDDVFDEAILRVDLNDDGDLFDRVKTPDVTGCPVVPVGRGLYDLDINNDGVFTRTILGGDYLAFFLENGLMPPALVYHEGTILSGAIHIAGQCVVTYDPDLASPSPPIGFDIDAEPILSAGVHSWREIVPPQ